MRNFRKYDVWLDGIEYAVEVYDTTENFPSNERFGLTSQIRRAVVSIPSNVAEGSSRTSDKEFSRFVEISLGSSFELETHLILSQRRRYISTDERDKLLISLHSLQRRLNALRTKLLTGI